MCLSGLTCNKQLFIAPLRPVRGHSDACCFHKLPALVQEQKGRLSQSQSVHMPSSSILWTSQNCSCPPGTSFNTEQVDPLLLLWSSSHGLGQCCAAFLRQPCGFCSRCFSCLSMITGHEHDQDHQSQLQISNGLLFSPQMTL